VGGWAARRRYFAYVVMLRAIKKASNILTHHDFAAAVKDAEVRAFPACRRVAVGVSLLTFPPSTASPYAVDPDGSAHALARGLTRLDVLLSGIWCIRRIRHVPGRVPQHNHVETELQGRVSGLGVLWGVSLTAFFLTFSLPALHCHAFTPLHAPIVGSLPVPLQNVSRVLDCVSCEKCKLHGKLSLLGLGTALKILLVPDEMLMLSREEVVALVNTLEKLARAIHYAARLREMHSETKVGLCCACFGDGGN
jgi:hypothetical protein